MDALQKMEKAGFNVELIEGHLSITPASKLSPSQDEWIRGHRDELIQAIRLRDLELKPSPSGHDHRAANDDDQAGPRVTIEQLPERLVTAATRVCTELWNDDDEAVRAMMEDLCWHDPADWPDLIQHFEQQLPPAPPKAIPPLVTCSGCNHAAPSPHYPGIIHCRVGVESGAATGGWFDTDRHFCEQREHEDIEAFSDDYS